MSSCLNVRDLEGLFTRMGPLVISFLLVGHEEFFTERARITFIPSVSTLVLKLKKFCIT